MIVRSRPNFFQVLFAVRGSILPSVLPQVGAVAVLSAGVVELARHHPDSFRNLTPAPFTVLGLALSIFLNFRNTACYDRWWEGRRQWGQLVVEMRCYARLMTALFPGEEHAPFRREQLHAAVGFAHALNARLRGEDEAVAAGPWMPVPVATGPNVSNEILVGMTVALMGRTSDIQFQMVEARIGNMSAIQTACERIRGTPLPFAYSLLLHRTAYLFCGLLPFGLAGSLGWATPLWAGVVAYTFFGLDLLGSELEEPFGRAANDLPLDAMVRTIERDLLPAAGASPPPALEPVEFVMS